MTPEQKEQLMKEFDEKFFQDVFFHTSSHDIQLVFDFMVSKLEEKDAAIHASERFRAQDAMSHINEANELRAKLKQSEAKHKAFIEKIEALRPQTTNESYTLGIEHCINNVLRLLNETE